MRNGNYVVRMWTFLGKSELHFEFVGDMPIVKASNAIEQNLLQEVPDEIRAFRRDLRFDYGKFDYVLANGVPILIDANRTPTAVMQIVKSNVHLLPSALEDFLGRPKNGDGPAQLERSA